ncbi:hypothetical protein DKX15_12930 [Enterococcus faecium]|nr:hypothetical protein DKX15_12930 [Enterococcus faecium]RAX29763.1 hypothetical protein DQE80_13015 [Enterococcus sp. HPCN18]
MDGRKLSVKFITLYFIFLFIYYFGLYGVYDLLVKSVYDFGRYTHLFINTAVFSLFLYFVYLIFFRRKKWEK